MAEIITPNKKGKRKVFNTRVDLTPMVDLGFLLITFFVFTTTLSEQKALRLLMPMDSEHPTNIPSSGAVSLVIGSEKVWYYEGMLSGDGNNIEIYEVNQLETLRQRLIQVKRRLIAVNGDDKKMMVLIKPTPVASLQHIVDLLDEMLICAVGSYTIVDASNEEQKIIQLRQHLQP